MPHMEEIYGEYHQLGVEVYGVSVDENRDALDDFIDDNDMSWTIAALGGFEGMAADFGVNGIPSLFVLSPEGEVIWAGHPMGLSMEVMDDIVEEHLDAERPEYIAQSVMSEEGSFADDDTRTYDGKFVDVYEIELEEGERYTISIGSDDVDTLLAVHSPDGNISINDDAAEGDTNSSVSIRGAEGGVYKIYATTFSAEETGDYTLDVDHQVAEGAQN